MRRSLAILTVAVLLATGLTVGKAVVAPLHVSAQCGGSWYPWRAGNRAVDSIYDYNQQRTTAVDFQTIVYAWDDQYDLIHCVPRYWMVVVNYWVEDGSPATFYTYGRMGFGGVSGIFAHFGGSPTGAYVTMNTPWVDAWSTPSLGACGLAYSCEAWGDDYLDGYGTSYYLNGGFSPSSGSGYSNG